MQQTELQKRATRFFLEHSSYVRLVAFQSAPGKDLIDDIVNDAFVAFVSDAGKWDPQRNLLPVLRAITQNMAKRYWRERTRNTPPVLEKLARHLMSALDEVEQDLGNWDLEERKTALDLCMQKLSPESQFLLEEHYLRKTTLTVIAEKLKKTAGAIRNQMFHIRKALRECIEKTLSAWIHS